MYPDYLLRITYTDSDPYHDGYCSDPREITYSTSNTTRTFPLLKMFKMSDLSSDNLILRTYYPCNDQRTGGCKRGSGYCGSYSSRSIDSATVIKKSDVITLDDD